LMNVRKFFSSDRSGEAGGGERDKGKARDFDFVNRKRRKKGPGRSAADPLTRKENRRRQGGVR